MKRQILMILVVTMISLASMSFVRIADAEINSVTWIKPDWRNVIADPFLGDISIGYKTGNQWMLNINIYNDATNSTDMAIQENERMEAHIYRIAVWFDWNLFYNTSIDITMKYGTYYLFTITGTTELTSIASNLFTHSYRIYVEYEFTYQEGGGSVTARKTWGPYSGTRFAVLSQEQYDAMQASLNFRDFRDRVINIVDDYAESYGLLIQAEQAMGTSKTLYGQGEFGGALTNANAAINLLNQSYILAKSKDMQYDDYEFKDYQADIDMKMAQVDAINANASARLIEATALAQAMVMNSIALMFFGLGFTFFGVAAIVYAYKRTPKQNQQ